MKKILLLFLICIATDSFSQDCSKLPSTFSSYSQATQMVRKAIFKVEESVNTSKSSWIRGAEYYSCDGRTGYFILITDKQPYIYQDMPIEIWEGFKNAESFGSYYNAEIKGQWLMIL